jgi:hypothetical protein
MVASARHAFRIKSELLFAMVAALKDKGVRLANPHAVIRLGGEAPASS